jgi:hypothetical protein
MPPDANPLGPSRVPSPPRRPNAPLLTPLTPSSPRPAPQRPPGPLSAPLNSPCTLLIGQSHPPPVKASLCVSFEAGPSSLRRGQPRPAPPTQGPAWPPAFARPRRCRAAALDAEQAGMCGDAWGRW